MIDPVIQDADQYEILIVDDTVDNLKLLSRILEARGYRVRAVTNGRHALKSAEVRLPDLILLDVKMPEMDGYEVCRRLKTEERSRNVPVIFVSAYGKTIEKVHGFNAGAVDFITKPFEEQEVLARVQIHLRLRVLTEHLEQQVAKRTEELHAANAQLQRELTEHKRMEMELANYRDKLEEEVKKRTAELEKTNANLERMNKLFVGRELKMVELKKRIAELEKKSD